MKVFNLCCSVGHRFEGWFSGDADFEQQTRSGRLVCPVCESANVVRVPSAPRLNLSPSSKVASGSTAVPEPGPGQLGEHRPDGGQSSLALQAAYLRAVRDLMSKTEDVGSRFAEEARKIHYGEAEARGIRGQASDAERSELASEGIEVLALPIPDGLKGPSH